MCAGCLWKTAATVAATCVATHTRSCLPCLGLSLSGPTLACLWPSLLHPDQTTSSRIAVGATPMERTFSVDDLIGNVYRLSGALGGGMGNRTDSEAAFQEFLKRIPSATNLSAIGSAGGAGYEPGSLQQTAQQLLSGCGAGPNTSLTPTAPLNTSLGGGGGDAGPGGMPRVPSLDLLRQLVLQNSLGTSLGGSAGAAGAGAAGQTQQQPAVSAAALKPVDALSTGVCVCVFGWL